jgi:hypothetical protein
MFGIGKNKKKFYERRSPGDESGGGFTAFVWRSTKKIVLSLMLLALLGWSAFAANLDLAITGQLTWDGAVVNSLVSALNAGYVDFIPRLIAMFQHLMVQEPAQALLLNGIPNAVVYLFTFLWVSFIADILDQRRYEAFSFTFVALITLAVVGVLSVTGLGAVTVMSFIGMGG